MVVQPGEAELTSDAGLLPIREFDQRVGMTEQFADALTDTRSQPSVVHTLREMVRMRVFGILADYPDQNDLVVMVCLLFGTAHAALGARDDLAYLVGRLRDAFPGVRIVLRADSGFGVPAMYAACERLEIDKELKCGLQADRLSDHRYMANLFRLYLHATAYNLLARLRRLVADPPPEPEDAEVPVEALAGQSRRQHHNSS